MLYGDGSGGQRECPGEGGGEVEPCTQWVTAAGDTPEEKIANGACASCKLCNGRAPGQTPPAEQQQSAMVARIERRYYEHLAGLLDVEDLTPVEYEGLIHWCSRVELHERDHMRNVRQMCELVAVMVKARV